jgi:hypothetical protein
VARDSKKNKIEEVVIVFIVVWLLLLTLGGLSSARLSEQHLLTIVDDDESSWTIKLNSDLPLDANDRRLLPLNLSLSYAETTTLGYTANDSFGSKVDEVVRRYVTKGAAFTFPLKAYASL